jgi:hypothetical protein
MRARRARAGRSKAESSVLVQRVAGAVATVSEIDVPALVAAGVASLLAAVLPQQDALPLYRSCAPKKGRHPTAVIALMLAFALALFLVIRDMLEAPPSSPFLYEHQYTRIPHPPRVPRHLSAAAYYEQVGVTFPPQRDLVDMLNPWDFH